MCNWQKKLFILTLFTIFNRYNVEKKQRYCCFYHNKLEFNIETTTIYYCLNKGAFNFD